MAICIKPGVKKLIGFTPVRKPSEISSIDFIFFDTKNTEIMRFDETSAKVFTDEDDRTIYLSLAESDTLTFEDNAKYMLWIEWVDTDGRDYLPMTCNVLTRTDYDRQEASE